MSDPHKEPDDPDALEKHLREAWEIPNDNPAPKPSEINNRAEYINHYTRLFNNAKDNKLGMATRRILLQAPLVLASLSTVYNISNDSSTTQSNVSLAMVGAIGLLGLGLNYAFDISNAKLAQQMDEIDQKLTKASQTPEKTSFDGEDFINDQQLKDIAKQNYKSRKGHHTPIESRATAAAFITLIIAASLNVAIATSDNAKNDIDVQNSIPETTHTITEPGP